MHLAAVEGGRTVRTPETSARRSGPASSLEAETDWRRRRRRRRRVSALKLQETFKDSIHRS